jgi:hypothetical protein
MLVARNDVPDDVIRAITSVLFENRRDLALRTPLAALIRQPEFQQGTLLPVHQGALSYYDREKPSFLEEKAEFLALVLSFLVVLYSLALAFTRRLADHQKGPDRGLCGHASGAGESLQDRTHHSRSGHP